jgi:hypothetical protein
MSSNMECAVCGAKLYNEFSKYCSKTCKDKIEIPLQKAEIVSHTEAMPSDMECSKTSKDKVEIPLQEAEIVSHTETMSSNMECAVCGAKLSKYCSKTCKDKAEIPFQKTVIVSRTENMPNENFNADLLRQERSDKRELNINVNRRNSVKQLVCDVCGGKELIKQDGVFVCQSCGTKYSVEEVKKMVVEIDVPSKLEKPLILLQQERSDKRELNINVNLSRQESEFAPYLRDEPSFGFALLGFMFPLVGLVVYFIIKEEKPLKAGSCIKGVIWGIVSIVISVFMLTCLGIGLQ